MQLVVSDAHEGLKAAIARLLRCPWQRCGVHFLRDCVGHAGRDQHGLLAALIRRILQADSGGHARQRLTEAIAALEERLPKVAQMRHSVQIRDPDLTIATIGLIVERVRRGG